MLTGLQQCSVMQQVVRLLGDLGERYGAEHRYSNLRTPADAIKLLCINRPKLQEELIHAHEHGIGYRLIQSGTDLDFEDLHLPIGNKDLMLVPVIAGSGGGGGVGTIFAGVALVAAAIIVAPVAGAAASGFLGIGGLGAFGSTALAGTISTALGAIGTSLILGGVSQLLSPQPTVPNLGSSGRPGIRGSGESGATDGPQSVTRGSEGRQSYMFSGPVNSVGVGATIPVIYGEVITGSQLLSARVEVTDDSDPLRTAIRKPGTSTVTVGGEDIDGLTYASGFRIRRWLPPQLKASTQLYNRTLTLSNGNTEQLPDEELYTSDELRENYQILFTLRNGLFDFVAGPGTTLVDGFITYEISLKGFIDGPNPEIGRFQCTVQGLLLPDQEYNWMHFIQYPRFSEDLNPDKLETTVKIIDFGCEKQCSLSIRQNGFRLLKGDRNNVFPIDG